ncbi:MAG: FAD-binding protein [Rickettsiales bacterium]|nr:FAD-binding protein [Rickettsiales bacterium]
MTILVIADHDNQELKGSTLRVVTAAKALGQDVTVLVLGFECDAVVKAASVVNGVSKVLCASSESYKELLAEDIAAKVLAIAGDYDYILAPANTFGKDFMPRVAALLDVAQVSDVIEIVSEDVFKRPIYAGNAIETVKVLDNKRLLTIRESAFDKAESGQDEASVATIDPSDQSGLSQFVGKEETKSDRPELTNANIVISGGRGLGSKENFVIIESIADKLNAAVGASRAAVDAGYVPNDYQVGQTGKVVAPDLYIAVGISGAIQHIAGMKDSRVIVAINKDENAPIFEIADYGLVADLFEALPEIEKLI